MNIARIPKATLLVALFNQAKPQGLGFLVATTMEMSEAEAQVLIDRSKKAKLPLRYDYLEGRSCKVDITTDEFDPWLYNRDNGEGVAERVVKELRKDHP